MIIVGIDPGMTGAIALIQTNRSSSERYVEVVDMPVVKTVTSVRKKDPATGAFVRRPKYSHMVDPVEVGRIFNDLARDCVVYLEKVHAMPKQGSASTFNFGVGYGMLQGVLGALGFKVVLVTPNAWKKGCDLVGKDKDAARLMAAEMYPSAADKLQRKKDIGRADALMIAHYGSILND